jgi:hypothetical protein
VLEQGCRAGAGWNELHSMVSELEAEWSVASAALERWLQDRRASVPQLP